ncbi:hypothetical protein EAY19_22315, partial [Vibrio anguillarum]|nr:hypothetical protein [Vibrio anguillarum]
MLVLIVRLILLLLLTSFSFSASASSHYYLKFQFPGSNSGCWSVGDTISSDSISQCDNGTVYSCSLVDFNRTLQCWYRSGGSAPLYDVAGRSSCPSGQELSDSGICEVPSKPCDDVIGIDTDIGWLSSVHGTTPPSNFWCSTSGGGCGSELKSGTAFCGSTTGNNYGCIATYTITGPECALSDGD